MTPGKRYGLGKNDRLKSRKAISAVFEMGKRIGVPPFRIFFTLAPGVNGVRAGVGAGTKSFGRAVDRSRIRRVLREAYRRQKEPLREAAREKKVSLSVFFIYTGKELPVGDACYKAMGAAVDRLVREIHAFVPPRT